MSIIVNDGFLRIECFIGNGLVMSELLKAAPVKPYGLDGIFGWKKFIRFLQGSL